MKLARYKIIVGLLSFLALDAGIFGTGLYSQILSPFTIAGRIFYITRYERKRSATRETDLFVIGDSRIAEEFSVQQAKTTAAAHRLRFIKGGIGGSTLRVWYYLLREIDPRADRYLAIVIPLPSYRQTPALAGFMTQRLLDADILSQTLSSYDFYKLSLTYPDWLVRLKLWSRMLLQVQNYRADFEDFLADPAKRWDLIRLQKSFDSALGYETDDDAHPETMEGLRFDSETGNLTYPVRLTSAQRALVDLAFKHVGRNSRDDDAYAAFWIKKIVEMYRGTQTKIIISRDPLSPLPEVLKDDAQPLASFVFELQQATGVHVIEENTFTYLEQPKYFFDPFHLNSAGRRQFTDVFVGKVAEMLKPAVTGSAAPR